VNAVGLHRAGIVNFFHALLLPIGVGGVISFLDSPPLEIASGVCVCVAVIPVGLRQLRAPDATVLAQPGAGATVPSQPGADAKRGAEADVRDQNRPS
jgi:hypothetical protein